ncbi:hypothetical protein CHISP_1914 [Chitinispirillum alkaliphilum]|nr:hypothetical protein CHISP_1914 [Chitinispirillum alkaliphilum]
MKSQKKEMGFTALILIAALFILLGFIPVKHSYFNNLIEDNLLVSGADSVSLGSVQASLWRGIEIRDLYVNKTISPAESYEFSAEAVSVRINLVSAVLGRLFRAKEETAEQQDYFAYLYHHPLEAFTEFVETVQEYKVVSKFSLEGGSFVLLLENEEGMIVDGLFLQSRRTSNEPVSGIIRCEKIYKSSMGLIEYLGGEFLLDGSTFHMANGRGVVFGGNLAFSGGVNYKQRLLLGAKLSLRDLDLEILSQNTGDIEGSMRGMADLSFSLEPGYPDFDSLSGHGMLKAKAVHLRELPLQKSLVSAMVATNLSNLSFKAIESQIELSDGKFNLNTTGYGEMLNFKASGWLKPDMMINQNVDGEFTPHFTSQLPPIVATSLDKTEQGGRVFKCRLYGNLSNPRLELDQGVLRGAVRSTFSDVREGFRRTFR